MNLTAVVKFVGGQEYALSDVEFDNDCLRGYVMNGAWNLLYSGKEKVLTALDASGNIRNTVEGLEIDTLHIEYNGSLPQELVDDIPF